VEFKSARPRAISLDCLRGLAILGMVLSGMLPFYHHTLPAWMYHAQMPPPEHIYRPAVVGITWVDVVFPLFLFSLGAAVPLALTHKLENGLTRWRLAVSACMRGVLLLFFALYRQHLLPGNLTGAYGSAGYLISVAAFLVLFLVFTRVPESWPRSVGYMLRFLGWAGAIALLAMVRHPDGSGFTVHRQDPILVNLAKVVLTTSLIWLAWPYRITARILIMAGVAALYVARELVAWGVPITELFWLKHLVGERIYNGLIWAINPVYQQYLLITIPGTVAGDILMTWMRPASQRLSFSIKHSRWRALSVVQCVCVAIVCGVLAVGVVAGLTLNDWLTTCIVAVVLCALGLLLVYSTPVKRHLKSTSALRGQSQVPAIMFQRMLLWGVIWICMGLALVPFQQGIRKDPATLSFFFVTAGLASMLLIVFCVIADAMHRPGPLFLLVDNGQNPMIAYVAGSMFIVPLLQVIPAGGGASVLDWLVSHTTAPWPAFGRSVGLTLLVAGFVCVLTRLRIFWRT
jgi:predicted acyltransferase